MLFLVLPPADMLPPAGHRAGPGRAHTGPITRSGRPGGRPSVSPRALPVLPLPRPRLPPQSRSNSSSCPRPPRSSRPRCGGQGPGPGWHRPEKSVREKSRPGVRQARRPGMPRDPRQVPRRGTASAPTPEQRFPTSARTRSPIPPSGIDGAHPQVCARGHWAGSAGRPGRHCVPSPSPSMRVQRRPDSGTSALGRVWTHKHTIPLAPAPDRLKRLPFTQDTCLVFTL